MVADVATRRVVARGEVPRRLDTGAECPAHGETALLALADLTVQRLEVPARDDLLAESLQQPGRSRIVGQVG